MASRIELKILIATSTPSIIARWNAVLDASVPDQNPAATCVRARVQARKAFVTSAKDAFSESLTATPPKPRKPPSLEASATFSAV
jgi:hypothetical protein